MIELTVGLILAAIGGLTFLAYKHPEAYGKLFHPLFIVATMALWAMMGWALGEMYTYSKLSPVIEDIRKAQTIVEPFEFNPFYLPSVYLGVVFYLAFLRWLPNLISDNQT
jgi:hypothetical protein